MVIGGGSAQIGISGIAGTVVQVVPAGNKVAARRRGRILILEVLHVWQRGQLAASGAEMEGICHAAVIARADGGDGAKVMSAGREVGEED